MPKGKKNNPDPIDFEMVPRYQMGEMIEALTAQVVECQELAKATTTAPTKELTELALQVSNLKHALTGLAGGKIKKKRAPWGSKKKKAEA